MVIVFHGYIIRQKLGVKCGCYLAQILQFLKLGSPADKIVMKFITTIFVIMNNYRYNNPYDSNKHYEYGMRLAINADLPCPLTIIIPFGLDGNYIKSIHHRIMFFLVRRD